MAKAQLLPLRPPSETFEREIAALLHEDFPKGWIAHDVIVGEEQVDVLAVLPQGVFAIECKSYTGQIHGDANGPWISVTDGKDLPIEPRSRNPYRQALAKAFAVGDLFQQTLELNANLGRAERPWIHVFVVFPEGADFDGLRAVQTNPQVILPRGQARVIVFHPTMLSAYIGNMKKELDRALASALVFALGGKTDGTWMDYAATTETHEQQPTRRLRFKIVWEDGR
jgi:Nuclease-related domain